MKGQIFYSPNRSGKSMLATRISKMFNEEEVVWIKARLNKGKNILENRFALAPCNEKTKLIIFDDCLKNFPWNTFMTAYYQNKDGESWFRLNVNSSRKPTITIKVPNIIFTTNVLPIDKNKIEEYQSFLRRFDIIEIEKITPIDIFSILAPTQSPL